MQLLIALSSFIYWSNAGRVRTKQSVSNGEYSSIKSRAAEDSVSFFRLSFDPLHCNGFKGLSMLLRADTPCGASRSFFHRNHINQFLRGIIGSGRSISPLSDRPSLRLRRLRGGRGSRQHGSKDNSVFIQTKSGETIPVDAATIEELKARIQDKQGIPVEEQRLVFGSTQSDEPEVKKKGSDGEIVLRPSPVPGIVEGKGKKDHGFDPSVEEAEECFRVVRLRLSRFFRQMRQAFTRNRRVALAAGGLFGLIHGASVAFTVLFIQEFGRTGWPLVRSGLQKAVLAYQEAKAFNDAQTAKHNTQTEPARRELKKLAAELARLQKEGADYKEQEKLIQKMRAVREQYASLPRRRRLFPILIAAFEPSVLRDVLVGVWTGVTVSLATACSSAARTIGIGVTLGEFVSEAALAVFKKLELVFRRARSRLPAEAVMLGYLGPSLVGSAALNVIGRSVGCWVAYRMQKFAAIMTVSLLSARILLESVELTLSEAETIDISERLDEKQLRKQQTLQAIAWMLALASLHSQHSRNYEMPLPLKCVFFPMLGAEALLQRLANRLTETGFPKLR